MLPAVICLRGGRIEYKITLILYCLLSFLLVAVGYNRGYLFFFPCITSCHLFKRQLDRIQDTFPVLTAVFSLRGGMIEYMMPLFLYNLLSLLSVVVGQNTSYLYSCISHRHLDYLFYCWWCRVEHLFLCYLPSFSLSMAVGQNTRCHYSCITCWHSFQWLGTEYLYCCITFWCSFFLWRQDRI